MAAGQWYLVVNGAQAGPFSQDDVMARLRAGQIDRATLVFTAGMSQWTPLGQVPELAGAAASGFATPPPPPPGGQRAHEIAYKIYGEDLQFVDVELDPRESVVAEAGGMMYMTPGIEME
ncbi:MAG: GYF domain-containing protein, partial [Vicinamibacteria bacterium]